MAEATPGRRGDTIDLLRHDFSSLAQAHGSLVQEIVAMKRDDIMQLKQAAADAKQAAAVREVEDRHLDDRLDRIEKAIENGLTSLNEKVEEGLAAIKKDTDDRFKTILKPVWAAATALIMVSVAVGFKYMLTGKIL